MTEAVPQPISRSKNLATKVAGWAQRRHQKRPEFLLVSRASLAHPELGWTAALVQAAIAFRERVGQGATNAELAGWLCIHPSTVSRARAALESCGPYPDKGGFLRVPLADISALGGAVLDTLALAQIRGWGDLRIARRGQIGWQVPAWRLAEFIGCCVRTAYAVLERLQKGFVDTRRAKGKATAVRVLEAGRRPLLAAPAAAPAPKPAPPSLPAPRQPADGIAFFERLNDRHLR